MKRNRKIKPRTQRLYFVIFCMTCLALAAYFVTSQFKSNMMFFVTPAQISERGIKAGEEFRLGGLVKKGSFKKLGADEYVFIINDAAAETNVTYKGLLPNLFREGQGVIATGSLNDAGVFTAKVILAKHDESYMPKEVYDELKKTQAEEQIKQKGQK